jgi:hypothetical protein
MRVLLVTNLSAPRCGIQNFGVQTAIALRNAGAQVTEWDGCYQAIYEKPYLPEDAITYDVIHLNWHPVTINHYCPDHFPRGPLLSVYLNDLPPWSSCPIFDRADVRFSAEPHPRCITLPYPIADWIEDLPDPPDTFTVGWSGVRGDGAELLRDVCGDLGVATNPPDGVWRSFDDEVRRQAQSTVNVLWYHEQRGISGGASQAAAARRAVLLNNSRMFAHFWPYEKELYLYREPCNLDPASHLKFMLEEIWTADQNGTIRTPYSMLTELGWSTAAARMLDVWQAAR